MENRRIVNIPVHEGPVKAKPDDFEPLQKSNDPQAVDIAAGPPPPSSYSCPAPVQGERGYGNGERR